MIATFSKIKRFNAYKVVHCYTLKVSGKPNSEFMDFVDSMNKKLDDINELIELVRLIENIAGKWGIANTKERYFKPEDNAHRFVLPIEVRSTKNSKYGLRLYCVILADNVLVILNGDTKTAKRVKDCPNCKPHFDFANKAAQAMEVAITRGKLEIDEEGLLIEDDFTLRMND